MRRLNVNKAISNEAIIGTLFKLCNSIDCDGTKCDNCKAKVLIAQSFFQK